MKARKGVEIACPACGQEALLVRQPLYEGLARTGEKLLCSACGHEFASEDEVPFKQKRTVRIFTEADRSPELHVFEADEARICRHCANYVINPFTQWCGLHRREVEATDSCPQFRRKPEEPKAPI